MRTHFPEKAVPSGSECGKQYERITAGRLAYEKWVEADEPATSKATKSDYGVMPKHNTHSGQPSFDPLGNPRLIQELHIATERRNKHVQMLKTSLALVAPLLNIDLSSQLLPASQFLK